MKAQITLDYSNDTLAFGGSGFLCIDIGENESKYISINRNTNSFSLYNMDMSPFMTDIMIPVTDSIKDGFVVMYVTRTLFDCDSSNIEYVYSDPVTLYQPFRILRTDGTLLLYVDSARGPYGFGGGTGGSITVRPIKKTSDGTKLFLDKIIPGGGNRIDRVGVCYFAVKVSGIFIDRVSRACLRKDTVVYPDGVIGHKEPATNILVGRPGSRAPNACVLHGVARHVNLIRY